MLTHLDPQSDTTYLTYKISILQFKPLTPYLFESEQEVWGQSEFIVWEGQRNVGNFENWNLTIPIIYDVKQNY